MSPGGIRIFVALVFFAGILGPAITSTALSAVQSVNEGTQMTYNQLQTVAEIKQRQIDTWLDVRRSEIAGMLTSRLDQLTINRLYTDSESVQTLARGELTRRLDEFVTMIPHFSALLITNLDGEILVESHEVVSADTQPVMQLSHTLADEDGAPLALLVAEIPYSAIAFILQERAGLSETGETYLVDTDGLMLTASRFTDELVQVKTVGFTRTRDTQASGEARYRNYRDDLVLGHYRWLPDPGVVLLAEQRRSEALAATQDTVRIVGTVALVSISLVTVVALLSAERGLVQPLNRMARFIDQIEAGTYTDFVQRDHEIGMLSRTFESLSRRIPQTVNQLQARLDQLTEMEQQQREADQERSRLQQATIDAQQAALKELSTPIMPLARQIIALPLLGNLTAERIADIRRTLMAGISQYNARVIILDLTAVTDVEAHLLDQLIRSARFKGAQAVVTGIPDPVAEQLADLTLDWQHVVVVRDLHDGLHTAFQHTGVRIR